MAAVKAAVEAALTPRPEAKDADELLSLGVVVEGGKAAVVTTEAPLPAVEETVVLAAEIPAAAWGKP